MRQFAQQMHSADHRGGFVDPVKVKIELSILFPFPPKAVGVLSIGPSDLHEAHNVGLLLKLIWKE